MCMLYMLCTLRMCSVCVRARCLVERGKRAWTKRAIQSHAAPDATSGTCYTHFEHPPLFYMHALSRQHAAWYGAVPCTHTTVGTCFLCTIPRTLGSMLQVFRCGFPCFYIPQTTCRGLGFLLVTEPKLTFSLSVFFRLCNHNEQ